MALGAPGAIPALFHFPVRRKAAYAFAGYEKTPKDGARHSFASYWLPGDSNFGQLLIYMGHSTIQVLMAHYRRHADKKTLPNTGKFYRRLRPRTSFK